MITNNITDLINPQHLHTFWTFVKSGSYTETARLMNLSVSTVSRHISALEEAWQDTLYIRLEKDIELTEVGNIIFRYAESFLTLAQQLQSEVKECKGKQKYIIPLACNDTVGNYLLPKILVEFQRLHPNIEIKPWMASTEEVEQKVAEQEFPVGIISGRDRKPGIDYRIIAMYQLLLVASSNHEIFGQKQASTNRLEEFTFLTLAGQNIYRRAIDNHVLKRGFRLVSLIEMPNIEYMKQSVINGIGLAFLPDFSVANELRLGLLRRVPQEHLIIDRNIYVITAKGDHPLVDEALLRFINHLSLQTEYGKYITKPIG